MSTLSLALLVTRRSIPLNPPQALACQSEQLRHRRFKRRPMDMRNKQRAVRASEASMERALVLISFIALQAPLQGPEDSPRGSLSQHGVVADTLFGLDGHDCHTFPVCSGNGIAELGGGVGLLCDLARQEGWEEPLGELGVLSSLKTKGRTLVCARPGVELGRGLVARVEVGYVDAVRGETGWLRQVSCAYGMGAGAATRVEAGGRSAYSSSDSMACHPAAGILSLSCSPSYPFQLGMTCFTACLPACLLTRTGSTLTY